MAEIDIAHLKIQNVDVVIAFLNSSFDQKSQSEQNEVKAALQVCSHNAGLVGNVVLVWKDAFGRFKFLAPPNQHAYFRTADYPHLYMQINRRLTCG
jgi:hypothetical protein